MAASPDKRKNQTNVEKEQKIYNNPFSKRFNSKRDKSPIDQYIKAWIEDIFYNNKKIDIQAKATIYRKLISQKFYELSSSSMVQSIIRQKIKEICCNLRKFINHSYETLNRQSQYLCNISDDNGANKKQKDKNKQGIKNIILPLSKMYVVSYRYMCEVAKETFHFWKVLYQCTQSKDLKIVQSQAALNQFILQTFVQSNQVFQPKLMLKSMPFHQKCKFIYAEVQGIKKRQELTHFYEDQTVKKLFVKRQGKKDGAVERQLAKMRFEFQPQEHHPITKRIESFFQKQPRMDCKDIEYLRNFYLQTQESNQQMLFNNLFAAINPENHTNKVQDISFSQQKIDLIKSLESNNEKLFELEDASSQDQIQEPFYYDNEISSKEELIDYQDQLQKELSFIHQKNVNIQTQSSSKSELNEQTFQNQDLPMKNYEDQPIPPQFIPQSIVKEEHYEVIIQRERAQMQRAIEFLTQYNETSAQQQERNEDKFVKLKINIAKSKQIHNKQKKIEFLDKRQLEEEKEKLQKYRRQLQKQKEQLLREVEKFMKEKKKQNNLLALLKDNKCRYKGTLRGNYKLPPNHKTIHKQKHQEIESFSMRYDLSAFQELEEHDSSLQSITHIIEDHSKMKEVEEAASRDLIQSTKLTKKQQKLKKKQNHQANMAAQQSPPKQKLTEQQASLNTLLSKLQIDEDSRVNCNVEQQQILKWKLKANDFLSGVVAGAGMSREVSSGEGEGEGFRKKKRNKR